MILYLKASYGCIFVISGCIHHSLLHLEASSFHSHSAAIHDNWNHETIKADLGVGGLYFYSCCSVCSFTGDLISICLSDSRSSCSSPRLEGDDEELLGEESVDSLRIIFLSVK